MAREAVLQGDRYFGQRDYRGASVFYLKASQLGSKEGNKKYRQTQELLGDPDLVNPEQYAKNQKKGQVAIEKPKMTTPLSIPSEESRTLIEDRSKPQQKTKAQQGKQNKTAEKPKNEKVLSDNADELLKRALESEAKGNKREAFRLLREAADGGSEIAKSKVGQRYLKLAVRYLGRQAAFEQLGEKITPQQKDNKEKVSAAPKLHFRHQRNRKAELNGCGDMAETETSVLHAAKAEKKTWVGEEKKGNSLPPQVIIQELVRYVNYWTGNDCLPELILVDRQEPVSCESPLQSGHGFSAERVVCTWPENFTAVTPKEEVPRPADAEVADVQPREDVCKQCRWGICTPFFRKLFSIFRK